MICLFFKRSYHNVPSNYPYYSNQNQIMSNDQSQSHSLERTQSTKSTLEAAFRVYSDVVRISMTD